MNSWALTNLYGLCLLRERVAEHRIPALGLLLGSLVLNDIPVFDEDPILQTNDVRCDPVHRQSDVGESAMNDDVVVFCKNHPRLIRERRRRGLDEVEEPVSSRLDMGHLPKESERRNAKGDCIFEQSSWYITSKRPC